MRKPLVGIIAASDSDLSTMQQTAIVLDDFGITYEISLIPVHSAPERLSTYTRDAQERGVKLIIAGAGGAAHLPGMAAAHTALPVIGVPIANGDMQGLDALLSIAQMPAGVPVATVGINAARNAGLFAAQILGIKNSEIQEKITAFKKSQELEALRKSEQMEETGFQKYLHGKGPL